MIDGWETKTLGAISEIFRGGSPRPIKSFITQEADGVNWIKIGDTEVGGKYIYSTVEKIRKEGMRSSRYVEPGDFLLSNSMSFGRPYILKTDGCIHDGWLVIKKYERTLIQDFLYYLLLSPVVARQFEEGARGSTVRNLNTDIVSNVVVSYPVSHIEQQRIVDVLDREFAKIDALKANAEKSLQAAKDLFQATLKKELEPKEGWAVAEINSVCLKTYNIKWRDIPEEKEYTYIDLTSVDRSTKSIVEPQLIKKSNAPSRAQRLVCEDDIIFATTRPTLRRYCIIPEQYDEQICSTGFCVLRPDKRKVRPSWLFHCLSTDAFYDYVEPLQTGATYPAITDKDVKGYIISLPTITEQDDIVSRLNDLNDKSNTLQENYQKTLTLCDDLKQSLLRKAFNGEL